MQIMLTSKLGFFLVLRMTQDCTMQPPHSTCRLGEVTLASWKLFRLRNPHARICHINRQTQYCRNKPSIRSRFAILINIMVYSVLNICNNVINFIIIIISLYAGLTSIAMRCRTGLMPCGTIKMFGSLWGGG